MSLVDGEKEKTLPRDVTEHVMAGRYEYEDTDPDTGIKCPCPTGNYIIKRPHGTFRYGAFTNPKFDGFSALEHVTLDPDDILICSFAKTGTNFCFDILTMLTSGQATRAAVPYHHKFLDAAHIDHIMKVNKQKPKVLHTHIPVSCLPPNFRHSNTKVIVPMRNMKDTFVSFYHFMNSMAADTKKRPWADYFTYLLYAKTVMYWGPFGWYSDLWDNHRNDPNILIVFYEELIINPAKVIRQMADHIGVTCSEQFIGEVTKASRFNKVKPLAQSEEESARKRFKDFALYRKGEIGDWKNWFTLSQNEEFHKVFDEWNKDRQIPFIYDNPASRL